MKKQGLLILTIIVVFTLTLAACTNQANSTPSSTPESQQEDTSKTEEQSEEPLTEEPVDTETNTGESNILIAYFSSQGNIVTDEEPRGNVGLGKTRAIAEIIQEQVGGDLFFIEVVDKYPANYNDTIDVAMQELRGNDRPELASHVENFDDYDVIFIGYPIWWGTLPQANLTFLEEYDFSGKTVIPFCTYQDSGIGRSVQDLENAIPDATVLENFSVRQAGVENAEEDIKQWIDELNLLSESTPQNNGAEESAIPSNGSSTKTLVAYFSMPETTAPNNMTQDEDNSVVVINGEVLGNTQYVAYLIEENTKSDIFRIESQTPYPPTMIRWLI
jgi:flavodoxin